MTLTRAEITAYLIKHNFPKLYAQSFVDDFFDIIAESLERGEEVKFSGFGNFELKLKQERPGRNPKTGEATMIPSRKVVTFKAGNKLQERLQTSKAKKPVDESVAEAMAEAMAEAFAQSGASNIQMQITSAYQSASLDGDKLSAAQQDALATPELNRSGTKIITIVASGDEPFVRSNASSQVTVHGQPLEVSKVHQFADLDDSPLDGDKVASTPAALGAPWKGSAPISITLDVAPYFKVDTSILEPIEQTDFKVANIESNAAKASRNTDTSDASKALNAFDKAVANTASLANAVLLDKESMHDKTALPDKAALKNQSNALSKIESVPAPAIEAASEHALKPYLGTTLEPAVEPTIHYSQGQAGSTIKRHTQLGLASTFNQEMPTELMKTLDAQSQTPKQTLFMQQGNISEIYLDEQHRERKQQREQKQVQEQLQRQEEQKAMAQEIDRELELKSKRKGRGIYRTQDNQRKFEPEH